MRQSILFFMVVVLSGCASTGWKRTAGLTVGGAVLGAVGGAAFSPNDESRGLNSLVFGLTGALTGGLISILTGDRPMETKRPEYSENLPKEVSRTQEYRVDPSNPLPDFVKNRIQPVVVEEYVEAARIGEDGTLSEPHKVYRIKRPAEFSVSPILGEAK